MAHRIEQQPYEWLDRTKTIGFEYEGEPYRAYSGDVISSALLAADVVRLARSFKYHRPRGVLSFANHDANVLLHAAGRTNIRADVEAPIEGEAYRAVNTIGGLRFDVTQAIHGKLLGLEIKKTASFAGDCR